MVKFPIWRLKDLTEVCNRCQDEDYDMIIFIDGKRGSGKSTLAFKLATGIKSKFNPYKDINYSREDVIKHLSKKIRGVMVGDEIINVAYKRDFYLNDQKTLIKMLNMYRDSLNIFIGCIPHFMKLDIDLLDLAKIRITIVRRGIAIIQTQNSALYNKDPWDIKNNQRIESKWTQKGLGRPRYSQLSTFRGILLFGDLKESQKKIYNQIKKEKRNKIYMEQTGDVIEEKSIDRLINRLLKKTLTRKSLIDYCHLTGQNYDTLRKNINIELKSKGHIKTFKDFIQEDRKEVNVKKLFKI